MLALTRKKNETITIQLPDGQTLVIGVAALRGNQVRLSIEADKEIKIMRTELLNG